MKLISHNELKALRLRLPAGTRVRLVEMDDPQAPPVGTLGTVNFIDDMGTIFVSWTTGSRLGLVYGKDRFMVV